MPFLLANWRALLLGTIILILGIQTWRLDSCKKDYHAFKVSVEALAKAQEMENARIAKERERLNKEAQDALKKANDDLSSRYAAARKRLRERPDAGSVPTPTQTPTLASACEPVAGPVGGLGGDQAAVLAKVEAALLDALERADRELAKYKELWAWSQKVR